MRRKKFSAPIIFAAAVFFSISVSGQRDAQGQTLPFQYAVKFVCGRSQPTQGQPLVVARGTYFTAINVHNPSTSKVEFKKKFAIALPKEQPGKVSRVFNTALGPEEALEIDCADISQHLESVVPFIKGFVIIESKTELDVVAVYTAAGSTGLVETIDVERVPARFSSTPSGSVDLLPVPDASGNLCRRDNQGRLIVTVRNQGTADAAPSVTRVDFSVGGSVTLVTPAIPVGGSADLFAPIPSGCFKPDCGFRIFVDSTLVLSESNEGNNTASGQCPG